MPPVPKFRGNYLGIDPGKNGGLAYYTASVTEAIKMPETDKDLWDWIYEHKDVDMAALELVGGYIEGVSPGPAMFNFGTNFGSLRMALTAASIPFELVVPRRWQQSLQIPHRRKKGRAYTETKTQWKNRLKAVAQRLFPELKVTLATSDALLIAVYCQRKWWTR